MKIQIAFAFRTATFQMTLAIPTDEPSRVFLSFSGKDTRTGFTSHLCAALERKKLKTFMDDKDTKKGEVVLEEIIKAIQESEFAVIIFSPNYAASHWCLEEAQMLVDRRNSHGLTVIPVFYGINPSDVRHQRGVFDQHFRKLEEDFPRYKVARWKHALTQAASYCGWNSKDRYCRDEAELVENIAQDILGKSFSKLSFGTENLVGITMGTCWRDHLNFSLGGLSITLRLPQRQVLNHMAPEWKSNSQGFASVKKLVTLRKRKVVLVGKDTRAPTKGNQKNETTKDALAKKSDHRAYKSRIPFLRRLKSKQQNQLFTNAETSTEGSTEEEQSKEDGQTAKVKNFRISFLQMLKGHKKYKQFVELLEMLRKLNINIPFAEVISQISKKILPNKRKLEVYGTVKPNHKSV